MRPTERRAGLRSHSRVTSRISFALLAVAGLGAWAGSLRAQEFAPARFTPGFYAGAELGGASYGDACDPAALSCDHSDAAGAVLGGYRFASRFAVELGWRDLGDARAVFPRLTSTNEVVGHVEGYDVSALLRFPFGRAWEGYLRGGVYRARSHGSSPEISTAEWDWSPAAGGGLAWAFRPAWQARFQYLFLSHVGGPDAGEADVGMLSAGVSYLFGRRRAR